MKYIYDRRDASEAGLHGHPQTEIRYAYPAATNLTPESLFDCWTFEHSELPEPLPPHIQKARPKVSFGAIAPDNVDAFGRPQPVKGM